MYKLPVRVLACATVIGLSQMPAAFAEPYGLLNGRSMNFDATPQLTVEAGVQLGDEFEHFGARVNYTVSPTLQAYGDIGQSELGDDEFDADGLTFGFGAFFKLDSPVEGADFAVHGSYHMGTLEVRGLDIDINSIVVEAVFSGQDPLGASGNLFWNANVGFARLGVDFERGGDDSETELMFGAGVTMPLASGSGELYGGLNYVDGMGFGAGYRHFLD
ncbi:MAG: hypothetical protein AB8B63_19110 [Granulosicoccus sp.]